MSAIYADFKKDYAQAEGEELHNNNNEFDILIQLVLLIQNVFKQNLK